MQVENKSNHSLFDPITRMSRQFSSVSSNATKKIGHIADCIFNYFHASYQNVKSYFWPNKNVTNITKEPKTYSEKVVSKALTLVKNNQVPKEEVSTVQVNRYATYAYEAAILAAPIYIAIEAQFSGQFSFFHQQVSLQAEAEAFQPDMNSFFGGFVDRKQLQSHGMLLNGDQIDHAIYQFGTLSVATLANEATGNVLNSQLHLVFSLIAGLPPVENAIMSLKVPQYLTQQAHELNRNVRKSGANFIKPYVIGFIEPQLVSATAAAEKAFLEKFEIPAVPNLGSFGNKLAQAVVKVQVTTPATELIAKAIDSAATKVSEVIVDVAFDMMLQIALTAIQMRRLDKSIKSNYMKNRFFGAVRIVLAGGINQPLDEFFVRNLGAGIYYKTGHSLLPRTIIYTQKILSYVAQLKAAFHEVEEETTLKGEDVSDEASIAEDTSTEEETSSEMDAQFSSMPDPLGFMGGIDLPKKAESTKPSINPKAASLINFNSYDTDEIVYEEKSSYFEEIVTSFLTKESEVDENHYYMGM